jgi:mutator protein MutT
MGGTDGATVRFPVSVKGVCMRDGHVVLVKNSRDEWELPGGKLERGETPEACVAREIEEELGLAVAVGRVLDVWLYRIRQGVEVLVIIYACDVAAWPDALTSPEGLEVGLFAVAALDAIGLPKGYHPAIERARRNG